MGLKRNQWKNPWTFKLKIKLKIQEMDGLHPLTPSVYSAIQYNNLANNTSPSCRYSLGYSAFSKKNLKLFSSHWTEKKEDWKSILWYIQARYHHLTFTHTLLFPRDIAGKVLLPCMRRIRSFALPLWNINFISGCHLPPTHLTILYRSISVWSKPDGKWMCFKGIKAVKG